jgi:hypothetical protein
VAEHDDGSIAGKTRNVLLDELQLICTEMAELAQIQRVDQRDQVYAGDVKAVPSVANGAGAERVSILLPRVVDRVVLSGDGENVRGLEAAHHLFHLVELLRAGQVGEVPGVDDEIRCVTEVVDQIDRVAECCGDVGVGRTREPEVAVADLGEPQGGLGRHLLRPRLARDVRDDLAAGHGESDRRTEPGRVPDELATSHAVLLGATHPVTTTVPCIIGWIEQT